MTIPLSHADTLRKTLISFLITAYFTCLAITVAYLAGLVSESSLNALDGKVIGFTRGLHRLPDYSVEIWRDVLQRIVLMLSDQQLVTGIAILAAGYIQHCTITHYHFDIVVFLAIMSLSTHLVTLTILRGYLRTSAAVRIWRVIGMIVFSIMLCVGIVLTSGESWFYSSREGDPSRRPAQCYWQGQFQKANEIAWSRLVLSLLLLVLSTSRLARLFPSLTNLFSWWLKRKPGSILKKLLDRLEIKCAAHCGKSYIRHTFWKALFNLLLALYINLLAIFEIYDSCLIEVLMVWILCVWGSRRLFDRRSKVGDDIVSMENKWGFGQLVPLLLLLLPLMSISEIYQGSSPLIQTTVPLTLCRLPEMSTANYSPRRCVPASTNEESIVQSSP